MFMVLNILMLYSTIIADSFFSFLFFLSIVCFFCNSTKQKYKLKSLLNQTPFKNRNGRAWEVTLPNAWWKNNFRILIFFSEKKLKAPLCMCVCRQGGGNLVKKIWIVKNTIINFSCRTWKRRRKRDTRAKFAFIPACEIKHGRIIIHKLWIYIYHRRRA